MKKFTMAVVLAGTCTGVAQAQTSVTIYGVIDEFLETGDNGAAHINRLQSGGIYGSRIGFKGTEELTPDLKAVFVLENGFNADNGSLGQGGLFFGRQSYVGLDSKQYGALTLGRQNTPTFYTEATYGLGGGLAWGNAAEYFSDPTTLRADNAMMYLSPLLAGFSVRAMYSLGEKNMPATPALGNIASAALQYDNGPWSAGVSFMNRKTAVNNTDKYWYAGTSYKFGGGITAAALYQQRRDDANLAKNDFYELGVTIPLPQASLLLDFGSFRNKLVNNGDARAYSLRYDYFLSKRTTLYAGIAKINNDSAASFTTVGATSPGVDVPAGNSLKSAVLGIRHIF